MASVRCGFLGAPMPFKSERQRRFMWANLPDIARKWAHGKHSKRKKKKK
jgi:hypothetical protein